MRFSDRLNDKMAILSPKQRTAIALIVTGEADQIPLSRLLKTAYSCQWCGRVCGRSGEKRDERKAALLQHEKECDRGPKLNEEGEVTEEGQKWIFAVNYSTYYGLWKSTTFHDCLAEARTEVLNAALDEAARILQFGTVESAKELLRQVLDIRARDLDRRASAVAILDRADIKTASKGTNPVENWLEALRQQGEVDGEMADDKPEGNDLPADEVPTESDAGEDSL